MKILETNKLIFRHLELDDLDDHYALYTDPDMVKFIPDAPGNYDEAREMLEWHMHGHPKHPALGLWATIYKQTNTFIGRCGLLPWNIDGQDEVEVAYMISKPYWGQGLGTEAARAILDYGFDNLQLPRLVCVIDEENTASKRVAEKIGMTFEKKGSDEIGPFLLYSRNKEGY